jgi:hypothetical protein
MRMLGDLVLVFGAVMFFLAIFQWARAVDSLDSTGMLKGCCFMGLGGLAVLISGAV